jgi:hypothetical protein
MDTKAISNLLLKIGGMLIIVLSISNIHGYVYAYSRFAEKNFSLFFSAVVIPNILPLLLGIFIFMKPGKITNKIIEDNQNKKENLANASLVKIEQVCLSTLGFYLLFQAVSSLVFHVAKFVQAKAGVSFQGPPPDNFLIFSPAFIATIGECIFALWLILKTKGIVLVIKKLRS